MGSPPRVRGKATSQSDDLKRLGITPAYAGKSQFRPVLKRFVWDHPRVCGEKLALAIGTYVKPGSPPRVRGKGMGMTPDYWDIGITPRVCGEKS